MKSYNYYWYHHMMPQEEQKIIFEAIQNKDYDKFIELYKAYSILAIKHGKYYAEYMTDFMEYAEKYKIKVENLANN